MFDIGFWELLLLAVVGLLVLGPERLPGAVRTASLWINKLRRNFTELKREIEREVGADEIKRDLHNQRIMESLREVRDEAGTNLDETRRQLKDLPYDIGASDTPRSDAPRTPSAPTTDETREHKTGEQ